MKFHGKRPLVLGICSLALAIPVHAADIDFSGLTPGDIIDELTEGAGVTGSMGGSIGVNGYNPGLSSSSKCANEPPCNAAVVFDSSAPPGIDYDLGTPNEDFGGPGVGVGGEAGAPFQNDMAWGNVLEVNEKDEFVDRDGSQTIDSNDSPVNLTDDADLRGQYIEFDFSTLKNNGKGTATINTLTYIDNDEGEFGAQVELWGPNLPLNFIGLPAVGDNGVNTLTIGLEGVQHMRVVLNGSGAVADTTFNEELERPCWVTTGGFDKGTLADASGKKICTFGGNIGPPSSGAFEVNWHDGPLAGQRFHTNDIEIIRCYYSGTTGPQQPGGKKGLDVDTLEFDCNGLLNGEEGYTCDGYLRDAGEPSGKKNNDRDEISLTVRDGEGTVVASCEGDLDGGNVQIHPPVGKPQ